MRRCGPALIGECDGLGLACSPRTQRSRRAIASTCGNMAIRSSDQVAAVRPPALTAIKVRAAKVMLTSGAVSIGARLRESGRPALGLPWLSINGERRQRGLGTLRQKLHLELAKRAEYADDQPPGCGGSIDVLVPLAAPNVD